MPTSLRALSFILASGLLFCATLAAQGSPELSIPASFKFDLTLPGDGNHFLRPARIFTDQSFHEVYVCDPGNGRILIFNEQGIFKFEFSVSEYMGSPLDVASTSDGYVIVLGSTREGLQLFRFDFDGLYLGPFSADESDRQLTRGASSIAIDGQNRVYALIDKRGTIVRCAPDGKVEREFPIETETESDGLDEIVYGSMCFSGDYLYVPISNFGAVNRLTADGKIVSRIGIKGTLAGQLNFPVSVAVSGDGLIMVLDKHRFNVVCYDESGKFLAEFGGKGISNGWFYHPTWLAIDSQDQVYVGQIFNNRIQVLSIPDLVHKRKSEIKDQAARPEGPDTKIGLKSDNTEVSRRWSGKSNADAFDCVEDDILHADTNLMTNNPNNPLSLTFSESVGGIYNA